MTSSQPTHQETSQTRKTRGPLSSCFTSCFASIFVSLTASFIASQLCSVFQYQAMCYSIQQDQGELQYQPEYVKFQLMSLLTMMEQGITLQYKKEKQEMLVTLEVFRGGGDALSMLSPLFATKAVYSWIGINSSPWL